MEGLLDGFLDGTGNISGSELLENAGNAAAELMTRLDKILKSGLPRPEEASQPGLAEKDSAQQVTLSILKSAPQA